MRSSAGVSLRNSPKLRSGRLTPSRPYGVSTSATTRPEPTQVPVQPLQVQQPLRHFAMPSLLHPGHAVEALHQAAGPPHPAKRPPPSDANPPASPGTPCSTAPLAPTPRLVSPTNLAMVGDAVPSRSSNARQHVGGQGPTRPIAGADLVQERKALATHQQPPRLGPRHAAQVGQYRRDDRHGPGPVVETPMGREELEGPLRLVPSLFGGGGPIPEPLGRPPEPARRGAMPLAGSALDGRGDRGVSGPPRPPPGPPSPGPRSCATPGSPRAGCGRRRGSARPRIPRPRGAARCPASAPYPGPSRRRGRGPGGWAVGRTARPRSGRRGRGPSSRRPSRGSPARRP